MLKKGYTIVGIQAHIYSIIVPWKRGGRVVDSEFELFWCINRFPVQYLGTVHANIQGLSKIHSPDILTF